MSQSNINFRMDTDLKTQLNAVCQNMGMSMTTAFTIFARRVVREQRIPFDVSADPFYGEANLAYLRRAAAALDAGLGHEHELLDDGDPSLPEAI